MSVTSSPVRTQVLELALCAFTVIATLVLVISLLPQVEHFLSELVNQSTLHVQYRFASPAPGY